MKDHLGHIQQTCTNSVDAEIIFAKSRGNYVAALISCSFSGSVGRSEVQIPWVGLWGNTLYLFATFGGSSGGNHCLLGCLSEVEHCIGDIGQRVQCLTVRGEECSSCHIRLPQ